MTAPQWTCPTNGACPAVGNCAKCPLMGRDVRQHRMEPGCWCGPVPVGSVGAWEHR